MRQRDEKGQGRLDEQQEGEDSVRLLDALDSEFCIARFGQSRGDPFANQKNLMREGFVNRALRVIRVREK